MVQIDPESGLELPGQHGGGLAIEDAVAGQASGQDFQAAFAVDAGRLEQDDGLADQSDDPGHDQLVGRLHGLSGAMTADVDDGLAQVLEDRQGLLEGLFVAADHDRQGALDGSRFAAADRSVEHSHARLPGLLRHGDGGLGCDGAHVDEQQVGPRRREDAVLSEHHIGDLGRVRQHRDHHVRPGHSFLHAAGRLSTSLHQAIG